MSNYKIGDYDIEKIQNCLAEIMADIHRVCEENNIRYVLDSGSLLGAIRHKGFIPWDDDLDIVMPRDDYERFIRIANKSLDNKYFFETVETNVKYPYNFGKVRAVNTLYVETFTQHLPIMHGLYIDVFPMDYVDDEKAIELKLIQKLIGKFTMARYFKLKMISRIIYLPFCILPLQTINKILNRLMKYKFNEKSNKLQKLCHYGPNKPPVDISTFVDVIQLPFGKYFFNVPRDYDNVLKGRYGDYMELPPESDRNPTHEIGEVKL